MAQATADLRGRFGMSLPRTSSAAFLSLDVIAGADGFGLGWQPLNPDALAPEVEVRVRPEHVVQGRLVDVQGQPAASVAVAVVQLADRSENEVHGVGFWNAPGNLTPWPIPVRTDAHGRFVLHGVGAGVGIEVQIQDDRFALQNFSVGPDEPGKPDGPVFVLTPAHIIEGRVIYGDTRAPVPHARLVAQGGHYISGQTDALGRFRLNPYVDTPYKSMTTGETLFSVYAYAPNGQPYLAVETELTWKKGSVRQTIDFVLPREALIRGKVTDASSGEPIAGAGGALRATKRGENRLGPINPDWQLDRRGQSRRRRIRDRSAARGRASCRDDRFTGIRSVRVPTLLASEVRQCGNRGNAPAR